MTMKKEGLNCKPLEISETEYQAKLLELAIRYNTNGIQEKIDQFVQGMLGKRGKRGPQGMPGASTAEAQEAAGQAEAVLSNVLDAEERMESLAQKVNQDAELARHGAELAISSVIGADIAREKAENAAKEAKTIIESDRSGTPKGGETNMTEKKETAAQITKPEKKSWVFTKKQKIAAGVGVGILALGGAIAPAYFFPKHGEANPTPIVTPTPSEAAGTPTPTLTPDGTQVVIPSVTPVKTQEAICENCAEKEYGKRIEICAKTYKDVSTLTVVSGDLVVNGHKNYDDNCDTGSITVINRPGIATKISAEPWGGSGRTDLKENEIDAVVSQQAKITFGTQPGIKSISVYNVNGEIVKTINR